MNIRLIFNGNTYTFLRNPVFALNSIHNFEVENLLLMLSKYRDSLKILLCGKRFYIHSLTFDIGKILNSGLNLSTLRRTKVGNFSVDDATSIEIFIKDLQE